MREQSEFRNGHATPFQHAPPDASGFIEAGVPAHGRCASRPDAGSSLLVACVTQRCRMDGVTEALAWLEEEIAALGVFLDPLKGTRVGALDVEAAMRAAPGSPLVAYAANLQQDVGTDAMLEIISAELAEARRTVVRLMIEANDKSLGAE